MRSRCGLEGFELLRNGAFDIAATPTIIQIRRRLPVTPLQDHLTGSFPRPRSLAGFIP